VGEEVDRADRRHDGEDARPFEGASIRDERHVIGLSSTLDFCFTTCSTSARPIAFSAR
jgi:hypothetical protein